jgi:hypothetical protein
MRIPGWQASLAATLEGALRMPFEWGTNDCCQFVARAAASVLGEDRRSLFPAYENEAEALRILASCGGLRALLTRAFGEPVHPSRAGIGDIVLVDMGFGEQPAVCMGLNCYAPGRAGLEHRRTLSAVAAWLL